MTKTQQCFRNGKWQVDELANLSENLEHDLRVTRAGLNAFAQKSERLESKLKVATAALEAVANRKTIGDEFEARKIVAAAIKEITAPEPANDQALRPARSPEQKGNDGK